MTEPLEVLASWVAVLESPDLEFGHWVTSEPDADGVIQMPWYDYSPEARRFCMEVASAGWVRDFDWMAWSATPRARLLIGDPTAVQTADAEDLSRLITTIIRGDRFREGAIADSFESGLLTAIAKRAQALYKPRPSRFT